MPASLKRNALCRCVLAKAEPALARAIIEKGSENPVRCLYECVHILKGSVPLKNLKRKEDCWYKEDLRALVQRKSALHERKRILQKGGFVAALLAPLATSLLAPLAISLLQSIPLS